MSIMCATTVRAGFVLLVSILVVRSTTAARIICPSEETNTGIVIKCNKIRNLAQLTDEEFMLWTEPPSSLSINQEGEEITTEKYKDVTILLESNNLQMLQTIPWNSSQTTRITRLSFKRNHIVYLNSGVFQSLNQLKSLDLSHNLLTGSTLIANVFRGTPTNSGSYESSLLEQLNLANNNISSLNADVFSYLPRLKSLTLSNNPIRKIVPDFEVAISSLTTLQMLNVADTQLSSLPDSLFEKNPMAISEIHLSENLFTDVPKCLKNLASSLRKLNLNANSIREIHSKSFDKLSNLEALYLNGMPTLRKIKENAFSPLSNLKLLECSHNKNLGIVDAEAFVLLKTNWKLRELYLNNNNLRYLSENTVDLDKLNILNLAGNPWNCTCSLLWLMEFTKNRQYYDPELNMGMRCEYPVDLNRKTLMHAHSVVACSNSATSSGRNNSSQSPSLLSTFFLIVVIILISVGVYFTTKRIRRANKLKSRYSGDTGMKSVTKYKLAEPDDLSEND